MQPIPAVLRRYMDGLKTRDVARVGGTVAEDLAFRSAGRTLNREQFLAFLTALYAAFPDWHYEHSEPAVRDDGSIAVAWRQGGTHTGKLELPDGPALAPTGKVVRMPEQFFFYRIAGERIVEIRPDAIPGGAPDGILEQLGVANVAEQVTGCGRI